MNRTTLALALILNSQLLMLNSQAAVPLSWTVEMTRATPAVFEAYQGETIEFEARLQNAGKPLAAPAECSFYWQTNGMGSAYWSAPASATSNLLSATWTPSMDVGARVYNCFIGSPSNNYHAAFQLRLRPSPGATPNVLPLPTPVIDFARVTVLNPPWPTNVVPTVDGSARALPKYLHELDFADSYPNEAAAYYRSRGNGKVDGGCSAVRRDGFLYRNFDFPFDNRAEFVVRMAAGAGRFASVGVAQVGTNLTEDIVTSGKWSRWYKCLPGATVDGVNENGVVCEINVVDTPVTGWRTTGGLHPLAAVRWVLDNATNAQHGAEYLAANIRFPAGWVQNFHYMVADERETWIVENGTATSGDEYHEPDEPVTMTNFQLSKFPWDGMGMERFGLLLGGANITNAWYTRAYLRTTNWTSEFKDAAEMEAAKSAWEIYGRERLRGKGFWQTVHTSIYDITNRILRVAVQEQNDFYTFAVPSAGGGKVKSVNGKDGEVVLNAADVGAAGLEQFDSFSQYVLGTVEPKVNQTAEQLDSLDSYVIGTIDPKVKQTAEQLDSLATYTIQELRPTAIAASNIAESAQSAADDAQSAANAAQATADSASAAVAGKADKAELNPIRESLTTLSMHLNAEDARVTITNYDSSTHMPSAKLEYLTDDPAGGTNYFRTVWNELTRWNWLLDGYLPTNYYDKAQVDAMVNNIPWGVWDSHTGRFSPDKTIQMSADRIILCAGASYQRTVTAEGTYFVWTANEPYTVTGVASNGYMRIEDAEGNVKFEVVTGDKVTAAANPDGSHVENVVGITHMHIDYPIEADAHPTLEICDDLNTKDWKTEDDPDCLANVVWTGSSGNYKAEVWGKVRKDALFIRGTYQRGTDPYIRYSSALDVQTLRIGGVVYTVGTAVIDGKTVLTLTR